MIKTYIHSMSRERRSGLLLFILTVFLILASLGAESFYLSDFEYRLMTKRFNRKLQEKERIMKDCLEKLRPVPGQEETTGPISGRSISSLAAREGITILEYIDQNLVYWSDNDFDVPGLPGDSLFNNPVVFIQNGWFIHDRIKTGNHELIGLVRIRSVYSYENDIVRSGFVKDFRVPESVMLNVHPGEEEYKVYNNAGVFLFSLDFPETKSNTLLIIVPLILWAMVLVSIIMLMLSQTKRPQRSWKGVKALVTSALLFSIIYLVVLYFKVPEVFLRTELFSPYVFSLNSIIPSLGHLFLFSIFCAVLSYIFYVCFPLPVKQTDSQKKLCTMRAVLFILGALLLSMMHRIFTQLVLDSNINFETYKVLKISALSIIGYVSVFLLLLVPLFIILKVFRNTGDVKLKTTVISVIPSFLIILFFCGSSIVSFLIVALLFTGLISLRWFLGKRKINIFNSTVLFSFLFGLYSLYVIAINSEKKTNENIKVQALSLSTENDPSAEHLLLDMWPLMTSDTVLYNMMVAEDFNRSQDDVNMITDYLTSAYFTGYWANYNINFVLCRENQLLKIGSGEDDWDNCFDFFNGRTAKYGHRLTGTNFYFIDNLGGRSYYIGVLNFSKDLNTIHGLFIELYSDINVFQPGYSELLIDKKFDDFSGLKNYSFAKYINGLVVLSSGDFAFNKTDDEYIEENTDYRIFESGKYKHVAYKNGNTTVVISRQSLNTGNLLISFAYLFTFLLLLGNIFVLLVNRPSINRSLSLNFRQKLQLSYIGILLFSFILIGVMVALFTVNEYRSKHYENIKEKLNSINIELENKISEDMLLYPVNGSGTSQPLNELLVDLSNIFNTDINIYNLNGFLTATSRPEIYYRNLTSRRMDMTAFRNVSDFTRTEFFQTEQMGNMKYISVYMPLYSEDYRIQAFLNLPYFRMQSALATEISNLIVAIINFTLLLILITMGLAVIISGTLTSPLTMLSKGLASVRLGEKSEHLYYSGKDEIGDMVRQYNRMVDELEESTHKLASTEREYAWREMAKQVAHEIKNPLTPMKLNVQQLLKSWKDNPSGFGEKLQIFVRNQIEYIDNLSLIASAFSSFAKMPGSNPVVMSLKEQINTTLELFRNTENITFILNWPSENDALIYADKEQVNGIFSNLIKNSIQAIPQGRKGYVSVSAEITGTRVRVSVVDNGSGIPENLRGRMFTPNFTTKSSGTGLGLSIVKKYVEAANGKIWFESKTDEGTTFFVEFPLKSVVGQAGKDMAD